MLVLTHVCLVCVFCSHLARSPSTCELLVITFSVESSRIRARKVDQDVFLREYKLALVSTPSERIFYIAFTTLLALTFRPLGPFLLIVFGWEMIG